MALLANLIAAAIVRVGGGGSEVVYDGAEAVMKPYSYARVGSKETGEEVSVFCKNNQI